MKSNPKHIRAMKDGKAPLEYLITSVDDNDAWVLKGGADNYGVRNWLIDRILSSTYEGAMRRHFNAWCGGQDFDPDSGYHHFHHIRACCAIVLDAMKHDQLIDDRDRKQSIDQGENQTAVPADGKMTMADYHDFADALEQKSTLGLGFSIREPRDAGVEHECIVQYTDPDSNGVIRIIASDGPFKSRAAANEYIKENPNDRLGRVSICTLTPQEE